MQYQKGLFHVKQLIFDITNAVWYEEYSFTDFEKQIWKTTVSRETKKGGIRLPYPTESQSTKKIVVDDNKLWINCVSKVSFNTV